MGQTFISELIQVSTLDMHLWWSDVMHVHCLLAFVWNFIFCCCCFEIEIGIIECVGQFVAKTFCWFEYLEFDLFGCDHLFAWHYSKYQNLYVIITKDEETEEVVKKLLTNSIFGFVWTDQKTEVIYFVDTVSCLHCCNNNFDCHSCEHTINCMVTHTKPKVKITLEIQTGENETKRTYWSRSGKDQTDLQ